MKAGAILLGVLVLAGCGGHSNASPESVARAWSAALDSGDNQRAASLFAPGAQVVQDGVLTLRTHSDAVKWNAALPCGGKIISITTQSRNDVLVVFLLDHRPGHACDGPGEKAAAIFRVRDGKIVLWHQTEVPAAVTGEPI